VSYGLRKLALAAEQESVSRGLRQRRPMPAPELVDIDLLTTPTDIGADSVEEAALGSVEPDANVATTQSAIEKLMRWSDPTQSINIAEELEETERGLIADKVIRETDIDEQSRADWLKDSEAAMDLAMQITKPKTNPWPGASNVVYPIMTEAADQFAARAYPAIVVDRNVVKGTVFGPDDGEPAIDPSTGKPAVDPKTGEPIMQGAGIKRKIADAIGEHMSWQFVEEMAEWEEETDKLLHILPIIGCHFRKTYFDPTEGRNFSVGVTAKDLIIKFKAKSLATAPRITECLQLYPYEVEEAKRAGYFLDQDYGPGEPASEDEDDPVSFYEQHRRLDLDGDGYAEPYIVTVAKDSMKLARIVARYDADGVLFSKATNKLAKIVPVHYYTKYDFLPNKTGGIYGTGFGQLLRPINEAVNATLNMLIDAGHLANTQGGFIGKGLSLQAGNLRHRPGEWHPVNAHGSAVKDALVPFVYKEPSTVLFQLLGLLIESGKDISSVKDVLTGELKAQTMSPTVFLSMVEQGLKVFTAIYKRIYRSLKSEFDKVFRLNRIYLDEESSYQVSNQWKSIPREFYAKGSGVEPVSDPKFVADAQRLGSANFLWETFKADPTVDHVEVVRRVLDAAQVKDIDKLLKPNPPPDPVILAKMAELEIKNTAAKADAIYKMAAAANQLAQADSKVAEDFRQWAALQFNLMQTALGAIGGQPGPGAPAGPPGSGGDVGGPMGGVQAPPGIQGPAPVPPGPSGGAPSGSPGAVGVGPAA
jgi:chaperonin GroES